MTKKKLTGIVAAVGAIALLAGCGTVGDNASENTESGGETKDASEITVGFLQRQLDAPFYSAMQAMAEDVAEENGFTLLFQNAGGDAVEQLDQAQTMLSQGADVIIMNALDPDTQRDQMATIAEEIPVIWIDTAIPDVGVTAVSSDNVAIGELSGELTAQRIGEGFAIEVGILNGGPGDIIVGPDRQQGFLDGLEAGGVTYDIVAEAAADYAQDQAVPAAESMLAANPDLDLILGLNDAMALGALTVLQDQGNTTTLVAASADGQKEALEIIGESCDAQYVSTGLNSPSLATERAMEIAIQLATGEATADDFDAVELTEAAGINCDNVADFYDEESVF